MSDANRVLLSYVEESTWGTNPGGACKDVDMTSESLGQDTQSIRSSSIRADRNSPNVSRSGVSASGDVNFELTYGTFDDWFQYFMFSSAWSSVVTAAASGTISSATLTAGSGTPYSGMSANQWIRVKNGSTVLGYHKIVSIGGGGASIVCDRTVGAGSGSYDEVEQGAQLVNGTTANSISLEKHFQDLSTDEFEVLTGLMFNTLGLTMPTNGYITGTFGFLGKSGVSGDSTSLGSHTVIPNNPYMQTIDNVEAFVEGTSGIGITSFSANGNNNLRARQQIASVTPIGIGSGTHTFSGSVEMYFTSATEMNKYRNNTKSSLAVPLEDDDGNAYVFDWPRVRYSGGRQVAGGINTDVIAALDWEAYMHETELITSRIVRWAA